jgi:hypothetical protein
VGEQVSEFQRRPRSPSRIEARDRRLSAIHEAGHAVIARHVGARVEWAEIWRNPAPDEGEKTWIGRIRFEGLSHPRPRVAMIAVAGAIAEHVWRDDADFLENEGEWAWDEEAIMSPTDWAMAGCEPGDLHRYSCRPSAL